MPHKPNHAPPNAQQSAAIKELEAALRRIGFKPGPFVDFIDRAVRESWSTDRLIVEVRASKPFREMFPGIPDTMTPAQYRTIEREYRKTAADFGINLDKTRIGLLFREGKSPDEWYSDALVFDATQKTDQFRQAFNDELTKAGRQKLDKAGWFKFLNRQAQGHLYDLYEATQLRLAGLGLSASEARGLGEELGQPGQLTNVQQLAAQVRSLQNEVQPELERAGIKATDLVLLEAGVDPLGLAPTVDRIVRSRRAIGGPTAQLGARQVAGSPTVSMFPAVAEGR